MEDIIISISRYGPEYLMYSIPIFVIIGIYLGLSGKAIFYYDFNDLGLSLGVFGLPASIYLSMVIFGIPNKISFVFSMITGVFLFSLVSYNTFKMNSYAVLKSIFVIVSKLVLSFLYIFHLYRFLTDKKRSNRGTSGFIMIMITPILYKLVKEKNGMFTIGRSGRPQINLSTKD